MAKVRRVFLGWDAPLVDKVRDHLLASVNSGEGSAPDLEGNLVVVPTRQAGRRLREALAQWTSERNTAVLSAQIVTPNYLFMQGVNRSNTAGPVVTRAAWIQVLAGKDLSSLQSLFPGISGVQSFQWAMNTGEIVQNLRRELADGAYTIRKVLEEHSEELEELGRWQELAALEEIYLSELDNFGKQDLCLALIESARKLDESIKRIVVAGVPDPSLLALEALKSVEADGIKIEILVHADESLADRFDEWGRPLPDYWRNAIVEMPDWQNDIHLEATPAAQAKKVLTEIAGNADKFNVGDIAVGAPDPAVIPFVKKTLGENGISVFDPTDLKAGAHPVGLLGVAVAELVQFGSYDTVAVLLRHPDFLEYLKNEHSLESLDVLSQLDEFQNTYLPSSLDAMLRPFEDDPKGAADYRQDPEPERKHGTGQRFTQLGEALKKIEDIRNTFASVKTASSFEDVWRELYKTIYKSRTLNPGTPRDAQFENAAETVNDVLREFRELERVSLGVDEMSALFAARIAEASYHATRLSEMIDVEGWLELPWNNRPLLIVTGMNEQFVPGGSLSDAFLPDSLRCLLGLRDDAERFARDVFLMQGMIKSRTDRGRACFIAGKTAMSNDPYKPSRLLFRCEDSELPARVEKLLAEMKDTKPKPYAELIFPLKPPKPEKQETYMSVTSFKSYLACPFRYYLGTVLGMEESSDDKAGLDAMDFGNIVHEVLQVMGEDKKLWGCKDSDKLGKHLAELAAKAAAERYGSPIPLPVEVSLISAQERLKAAARAQVALLEEGWVIKEVERGGRKFRFGDFTVGGRIDRVDVNEKNGRIRIIDYKTFDSGKQPESEHLAKRYDDDPEYNLAEVEVESRGKTKAVEKRWIDLQLPLYEVIYTQGLEYRDDIELAYFGLPKAVRHTGIFLWEEFNKARFDSAVKCTQSVIEEVKQKVFWPPADRVAWDDFEIMFNFENSVTKI